MKGPNHSIAGNTGPDAPGAVQLGAPRRLNALMLEDVQDDADLLVLELQRAGYDLRWTRVEDAEAFGRALDQGGWDVVLSDYSMPRFDAPSALRILQERGSEIPFIIVSGTIGEDTAVAAMKAGAQDYLVKGQLKRLIPALEREMREAAVRIQRKQAEIALRKSEARLRMVIERLPDVVLVQREGRLVYVNPAAVRVLGYERADELIGAPVPEILHPDDRSVVKQRIEDASRGQPPPMKEIRFLRREGTTVTINIISQAVEFDGEPAVLAIGRDITEEKKVQAQLFFSDRMAAVGTLAAGVAHEINNPLAAVIANLDFVLHGMRGKGGSDEEPLREAREAADRVREIVRDLKIFSRAEDGERRGPVDVHRVLESSVRMARNEIRHRARLVKEFGAVPLVQGNEARLGQVFLNLLVNAAQAIPEGMADTNEIRLSTSLLPDGRVAIEFRDTGSGMTAEVLRKLFTPFFTTKPAGVGTGLGLSICQRIVGSMGGEIGVESKVGEGTVFRVSLPAAKGATPQVAPARPREQQVRRARLLLVDDDPLVIRALRRILEPAHDLTCATSGPEVLEKVAAGTRFDVIVCDLMMPQMTGMELHARLHALAPDQAARMLFLTGGAFTQSAQVFLDRIPNPRLEKPFDPAQLMEAVSARVQ